LGVYLRKAGSPTKIEDHLKAVVSAAELLPLLINDNLKKSRSESGEDFMYTSDEFFFRHLLELRSRLPKIPKLTNLQGTTQV
jgi:hypothetical protein